MQLAPAAEGEKPKNVSLLKGMDPAEVDLDVALKLLAMPGDLGAHPESGESVTVHLGRFGPYVKCGDETRSLPADLSPLDVTLDQAVRLLKEPKTRGRSRRTAAEPIKVFDESPITGNPIKLLDGRYGPYVTDGQHNASLPKGTQPEDVTHEMAVAWLAEKAARKPARKGRKKAAASPTTSRSAAKPKTAKKKTKKKAPKKSDPQGD